MCLMHNCPDVHCQVIVFNFVFNKNPESCQMSRFFFISLVISVKKGSCLSKYSATHIDMYRCLTDISNCGMKVVGTARFLFVLLPKSAL